MAQVSIRIDYLNTANYSLIHNKIAICQRLDVTNLSDQLLQQLQVTCSGAFLKDTSSPLIERLPAGDTVRVPDMAILPDVEQMLSLTERVTTTFTLSVMCGETCLMQEEHELVLMAYDQWLGTSVLPQSLVSFVTPNHPAISSLLVKAAAHLKELTGSSSLTEYQHDNIKDVVQQVAAVYAAIHDEGLVYRSIPASYETLGQRITLSDQVLAQKLGNCIELALLFASALEAIGINCGIVIGKGHAYLGVWLVNDSCIHGICDDLSFLEKKCSKGIGEMLFLECTSVAQDGNSSFEAAVRQAELHLSSGNFQMFIDVRRCRLEKFLPLPTRVMNDGKWQLMNEGLDHGWCDTRLGEHDRYDLTNVGEAKHELSRLDIWERKLLDFSLRNSLLNLYLRRKAVQLISFNLDKVEDHLADGEEYCILSRPEVDVPFNTEEKLVRSKLLEPIRDLVVDDIEHHRLHTYHTETETKNVLKNIYRAARNAIEETGANSLFLAIGTLRWYETDRSDTAHYAPIILVPVEIVYKKGNYYIRTRDEEATLNITLVEFLRQNYDISIQGVNPLPQDGHGVDVSLVFALIRDALKDQKRWDVEEECLLGTFSFSKFLMWNDIHNHREAILKNPVIGSLVKNGLTWTPEPLCNNLKENDATLSPADVALPVAVDSSQMAAVLAAGKGNSFILYGPPGTGKSQTITNLIANALYQGKRVLFVAEKMAALTVVQSRLAKIGLEPFCLEMHSNKVTKRHVLQQLDKALNVAHIVSPAQYQDQADRIFAHRKELLGYLSGLHDVNPADGMSLYDCLVRYESYEAEPLPEFNLNARLDNTLRTEGLAAFEDLLGSKLETILKLVGQPSEGHLKGLNVTPDYLKDNLLGQLQNQLEVLENEGKHQAELAEIASLKRALLLSNSEKLLQQDGRQLYGEWRAVKAKWFIPRFFAKRAFLQKMREFNASVVADELDGLLEKLVLFQEKRTRVNAVRAVLATALGLQTDEDEMPDSRWLERAKENLTSWIGHADEMRDWQHWCNYSKQLDEKGLGCVVKALENRVLMPDDLRKQFFKGLFKAKADARMSENPLLGSFEGMLFDEKVKSYRQLTDEFQVLTQKELYARLAARIPRLTESIDNSSEIGLLNRNISNGGRGLSLRALFDQIPTLMPRLCPCMLMSPMSVSNYLNLSGDEFDLVIFDEASQMPTSEAVGAIARGKSLIVVGDPKQMPPTSFFSSTNVDEEEASIDDMESILEDCRTLGIPSLQLNWHYRSRHESLIAFSNNEYYEGSLITFPSVDDQVTKVSYVPVDGFYDKGGKRSNRKEAEAIVDEIVRRLKDEHLLKQSIGVIAFSVVQQALIEDILQERMDADKTLREAAESMYEPVFVKNLENVQGDERDVILFSIGYGPTKDGAVSMNFGPLNNAGGERRLNVAVSRARCEMMVFSTLKASQIDLRRSKAKGVEGLKHFLEYAETQTLVRLNSNAQTVDESVVAQQIARELEQHGFVTRTHVGRSSFKVDIAVSRADDPETYLMGILLDGPGYRDTQTTRDREIVQPSVLTGLKWKVIRVWSVDWYNNRQRVIDRVLEQLQGNTQTAVDEPVTQQPLKLDFTQEVEVAVETNARPYEEFTLGPRKLAALKDEALMAQIVEKEQPISMMLLCKRFCTLRGMARVTPTVQRQVADYVSAHFFIQPDRKSSVIWMSEQDKTNYKWYRPDPNRDVLDIPITEIRNAVLESVHEQFAIAADNLSLIAAKKLGFTRRGANLDQAFNLAIQQLLDEGLIIDTEGKISLP